NKKGEGSGGTSPPVQPPSKPPPQTSPENDLPPGWFTFSPDEGRFSVAMPDIPKAETETTESGILQHIYTIKGGDATYKVVYYDRKGNISDNPKKALTGWRDVWLKSLGNPLFLDDKDIRLSEYPGKEFTVITPRGTRMRIRLYLAGERRFMQIASWPQRAELPKELDAFLRSFRILPR